MRKGLSQQQYNLFKYLVEATQEQLLFFMKQYLISKNYTNVLVTEQYLIAEGHKEHPVGLIAHLDTVFNPKRQLQIFYDKEKDVVWSPQGLGADDRAGVFAIIQIIEKGYQPSIFLLTDEEKGGIGAEALAMHYQDCPFDLKYCIEVDRRGFNNYTTYNCNNLEFDKYIQTFGLNKQKGTFSDIYILAAVWGLAAINIGCGYYNEHSCSEYLNITELKETIDKLEKMIAVSGQASSFDYIEAPRGSWTANTDLVKCEVCEELEPIADVEWVTVGATQLPMCSSCRKILSVHKCKKCNNPFWDIDHKDYCPVCKNLL